jgi:CheY-like chemotaxis protein
MISLEHSRINCTKYGLVISDIRMPAMNGFDFVKNMRQIKPGIKVLLVSAFAVEEDREFSAKLKSNSINGNCNSKAIHNETNASSGNDTF